MLIDKGYYDYDYEKPNCGRVVQDVAPKNQEETQKMVARFGIGTAKPKPTIEELQKMAMDEIGETPKENK